MLFFTLYAGSYNWLFSKDRSFDESSTSGACDADVSGSEQATSSEVIHTTSNFESLD